MVVESRETSQYNVADWWPQTKLFPDLVPVAGFIIWGERRRKEIGWSLRDFGKGLLSRETLVDMGTTNWPEPATGAARFRSHIMAMRNVGFAAYHGLALTALVRATGLL